MNFPATTAELRATATWTRTERKMWQTEHKAGRITDEEMWTYNQYYRALNKYKRYAA